MADWSSSIELTHGDRVWVRSDRIIDELPSLDLELEEPSVARRSPFLPAPRRLPAEDATTDRPMVGGNRGGITEPPVMLRSPSSRNPHNRAVATPVPLYSGPLLDEAPSPYEKTPVTFDMGLRSATFMEDEPTDIGGDTGFGPSPLEPIRGDALADYDDELPSTEVVVRSATESTGTSWFVRRSAPGAASVPEMVVIQSDLVDDAADEISLIDDEMSLTLDLQTDWLVQVSAPVAQVRQSQRELIPDPDSDLSIELDAPLVQQYARQVHQTPLVERTPEPASRLAQRAPAPVAIQPLRSTVPSSLQTNPSIQLGRTARPTAIPARAVDVVTFCSGIVVGGACGATIVFLAATAALLA